MAKQLNVEMNFNANTTQAKQQIEQLKTTLNSLASGQSLNFKNTPLNQSLSESITMVNKLKTVLNEATNTNTGRLDLTAFTKGLNAAGLKAGEIREKLTALGPEGTSAFIQLSRSVQNADAPLVSLNRKMSSLFTTLKNTAKWQISSSILHGFMSTISGAYHYAQDLNESLNNIRIRTGQSTEEMARFAQQANEAAKALSTTTTAYTDAALIYYQQGLDDEQVKERTDITVKMANVTKDSAEEVSQQLTAVWNNFDKGGEKLEYIADVMNALGAATASSTDEIATGLQKFSAVAETAGMSYEYAASALATITAVTRQSADTVGTGLRTVLARLESLKLGETLEDGVGLTKYTEALQTIGVNVLDMNGNLREADDILDDMAVKWSSLSEAQKMATAETVGGIRQYATIMTLMENWDFMQENVEVAKNSEGTLQEQADIYAESWEAAGKRVKAAAQEIYNDLIDDDFFITILNGAEKILTFIDDLIKSLGGLPGLLSTISAIVFNLFGSKIANGMTNMAQTLALLTVNGRKQIQQTKADFATQGIEATSDGTNRGDVQSQQMANMGQLNQALQENSSKFSEIQQKQATAARDSIQSGYEQLEVEAQRLDMLKAQTEELEKQLLAKAKEGQAFEMQEAFQNLQQRIKIEQQGEDTRSQKIDVFSSEFSSETKAGEVRAFLQDIVQDFGMAEESAQNFINKLRHVPVEGVEDAVKEIEGISPAAEKAIITIGKMYTELKGKDTKKGIGSEVKETIDKNLKELSVKSKTFSKEMVNEDASWISKLADKAQGETKKYLSCQQQLISGNHRLTQNLEHLENEANKVTDALKRGDPFSNWATTTVRVAQGISSLAMGINSVTGSINTLVTGIKEGNLSFSQLLSVVTSLGMGLTMMIPQITAGANKFRELTLAQIANSEAQATGAITSQLYIGSTQLSSQASFALSRALKDENQAMIEQVLVEKGLASQKNASAVAEALLAGAKERQRDLTTEETAAIIASTLAEKGETLGRVSATIATVTQTIAQKIFNTTLEISTALMMGYAAVILVVVAAIVAIVAIISDLVVTQKEAAETIKKSTEAYEEEKQKVDELKDSLQEVKDKIKELKEQDTLSLVEQEELNKLERQEASLERQLVLQEKIADAKRKSQIEDIENNYKTSAKLEANIMANEYKKWGSGIKNTYQKAVNGELSGEQYEKAIKEHENYLNNLENLNAEYLEKNAELIEQAEINFFNYIEAIEDGAVDLDEARLETLRGMVEEYAKTRKAVLGESYNASILEDAFQLKEINGLKTSGIFEEGITVEKLIPKGSDLEKALLQLGIPIQNFFDALMEQKNSFIDKFKDGTKKDVEKWLKNELSMEEFQLALTLNVDGSETLDELKQKLEEAKQKVAETQAQLDKQTIRDNWKDNKKTAESVREGTTNITGEDWGKLPPEAQQYFQKMTDGTYELIGAAEEFYQVVKKISLDAFIEEIDSVKTKINNLKGYQNEEGKFDNSSVEKALVASGKVDQDQIDKWKADWGNMAEDSERATVAYKEFAHAVEEANVSLEQLNNEYTTNESQLISLQNTLATSCDSLNELDNLVNQETLSLQDGVLNLTAYCEGLIALGNNYENCTEEIRDMQFALSVGNEELLNNTKNALADAVAIGELAEAYELNADDVEDQAKAFQESNSKLKDNAKAAQRLSVLNQKMNKGIKTLSDNWGEWKKVLDSTDETSMDYIDTMQDLEDAVKELLGVSDETDVGLLFSDDKSKAKNLELIGKAAEGDVDAINALGIALAQATVESWNFVEGMQMLGEDGDLYSTNLGEFTNYKKEVLAGITDLENALANNAVAVGDNITSIMDGTGASWVDSLNQMAIATGMSVQQMNDLLNQLGVQAKVDVVEVGPLPIKVPTYEEHATVTQSDPGDEKKGIPPSWVKKTWTVPGPMMEVDGYQQVAQISTEDGNIGAPQITYTGRSTPAPSATQPSSGSCFVAGTLVSTLNSFKPIEKVEIGDIVLSYNEKLKRNEFSEVLQTMIHFVYEPIYTLYIGNEELKVTGIHRFLINKEGWIQASDLQIGDLVLFADGTLHKIDNITVEKKVEVVYNFEVSNNHNYYVSKSQILAHNKGGGSDKTNPAKHQSSDHKTVDRYKEITDTIDDYTKAIDKANTASDRLWGKDRLKSIAKANELLKEQAKNYGIKAQQASKFLIADQKALQKTLTQKFKGVYEGSENLASKTSKTSLAKVLKNSGLKFTFDKDGDITNYTQTMSALYKKYNKVQDKLNNEKFWNKKYGKKTAGDYQDRYEATVVKPLEEQISKVEDAIKQYEETKKVLEEQKEAIEEARRQIQDNNYEIIHYKLELKIDVDDTELEKIEYLIDKLANNFYQRVENLANYINKVENIEGRYGTYKGTFAELQAEYKKGNISQESYYEGLKDIESELYGQAAALRELDEEMTNYYSETLDQANEEIEKYMSRMTHVNEVLTHYKDIMSLLGKSKDYKAITTMLNGIAENNKRNFEASIAWYQELKKEREKLEEELLKAGTDNARKAIQKELDAAIEAEAEAENQMLDNAQETAEAYVAVWENAIEEIQHDFEMLMTDGMGFGLLKESLGRMQSEQDEYLTKTNQIYEMNDLLYKLESDSEKTTNLVSKQKIANFSKEIESLKQKNRLSKLDLDIAKARYQQLVAQIALEEAQKAKTTVRLHRDNEGNYGYMYTADPSKVSDAQAALEKANNDLYNIVLEGTNNYGQKSIEIWEEYQNAIDNLTKEAQENGTLGSKEYYENLLKIQDEYQKLMLAYEEQYNTSLLWLNQTAETDYREAWIEGYETLITKSEVFYKNSMDYIGKVEIANKSLAENLTPVETQITDLYGNIESATKDLTTESKNLKNAIVGKDGKGGLVNAIGTELQGAIEKVYDYLEKNQPTLKKYIKDYEDLASSIAKILAAQSKTLGTDAKTTSINKVLISDDGTTQVYLLPDNTLETVTKNKSKKNKKTGKSFDTGGYTGDWGPEGKLAMLHQKELVLNASDTKNLLTSIDILRQLNDALDLQAMSAGLASISSASVYNSDGTTMQQEVTIHAEFPNAVNHSEIEMAFDTLINRASQYAGR